MVCFVYSTDVMLNTNSVYAGKINGGVRRAKCKGESGRLWSTRQAAPLMGAMWPPESNNIRYSDYSTNIENPDVLCAVL